MSLLLLFNASGAGVAAAPPERMMKGMGVCLAGLCLLLI